MASQAAGGFATQTQEITRERLPVQGAVPVWLEGTLLRNGPAQFEVGEQRFNHWFDGLAMLHSFTFHQGNVDYANRFLQSPAYRKARETGKISYSEFATDPCRSIFKRVASTLTPPEPGVNANVNISKIGKAFVAITETPWPVEFDPKTLQTVGLIQHGDDITGQHSTPHPHYDPQGKMGINSITQFGPNSHYHLYGIKDGETKRTLIGSIPVQEPGYIHSFGMTKHFLVLVEFPLLANPMNLLQSGKAFIENFQWQPEHGARFFVMRKEDGQVVNTYQSEAFFAFHHINAFEREGSVVVDIAALPDASIIEDFYLKNLTSTEPTIPWPKATRYTLPLDGFALTSEILSEEAIELPTINYQRNNGKEYQFAYGTSVNHQTPKDFLNQLVKIDTREKSARTWYVDGCYPGEPIFVAAPGATREDEGVVLSVVFDGTCGTSFLLILDAASFSELARAEVSQHVPFGFHGMYTRS
jgi:carotenoid cleavage dioxygenase-like enzyme